MNGNFDTRQGLKHSDMTVDARGWLTWDQDDDFAEITITVTQDGYECDGQPMRCRPKSKNPGDRETWEVDVTRPGPPRWRKGPASGHAAAVVTKTDGTKYDAPWWSPPLTLG
jgi:hypothetical protein